MIKTEEKELSWSFNKILELKVKPAEAFVRDYTYWDDMVNFVKTADEQWAIDNIKPGLKTFDTDAVWVYKTDGSLAYSVSDFSDNSFKDIPLPKGAVEKIFSRERLVHFFINTSKGLMEIFGATIHPTKDPERKTPPQGYYLAGKLWDKDYIGEIGQLINGAININFSTQGLSTGVNYREGIISSSKTLNGWDGAKVAHVNVMAESLLMKDLTRYSKQLVFVIIIIVVVITFILLVFIHWWVNLPLWSISQSLTKEDITVLDKLEQANNEFGDISRLILKFFEQKKELISAYEQLKIAQSQLIQTAKMASIGTLAGGVAHEINNPLTGVLNNAQLIKLMAEQKKDFNISEFKDLLNAIEESALRCKKITQSLLSFSYGSKGMFQPVSLNDVVEKIVVFVEQEFKLQNIVVQKELEPNLPLILGDPQLLQQVVFDIVVNAGWAIRKLHEQAGGAISLTTSFDREKKLVCLAISDSGIGIAKEDLDKIFEPFFTTKQVGEGTGLGLSIVYNVISAHSGSIKAESQPGKGSTFTIKIPAIS